MTRMLIAGIAAGALAVSAGGGLGSPALAMPLGPGAVAPNFTKNQLGGGSVSLSNYSGKVVVLFLLGYG